MKSKPVMGDLEQAIVDLLHSAQPHEEDIYIVSGECIRKLQAETNIYFREPEEEQIDYIQ